jgi:hypothetical protein
LFSLRAQAAQFFCFPVFFLAKRSFLAATMSLLFDIAFVFIATTLQEKQKGAGKNTKKKHSLQRIRMVK